MKNITVNNNPEIIMSDTRKISIRVTGLKVKDWDNGGKTITLEDGANKYQFSSTKRDGSITKAFEGYEKLKLRVGDIVVAEVSEQPASFKDKKTGAQVSYTKRNVMFFYTDGQQMEKAQSAPSPTPVTTGTAPQGDGRITDRDVLNRIEQKLDTLISILNPVRSTVPQGTPGANSTPTIMMEDEYQDEIRIEDVPF